MIIYFIWPTDARFMLVLLVSWANIIFQLSLSLESKTNPYKAHDPMRWYDGKC